MEGDTGRTIHGVERACAIVDVLERERSMGVTELAEELEIAKGTLHPYLTTLTQQGYVTKEGKEYKLSLRFIELGETVKRRTGLNQVVTDELDALAEATDERTQFATIERDRVAYVYRAEGDNAIPTSMDIGQYVHLHCVAVGKAMLAHLPPERVTAIIEKHGLPQETDQTITDPDELRSELKEIRDRGYAIDRGERVRGVRCIAAPLRNDDSKVFGAISISGPARRMSDERIHNELSDSLLRSANVIEVNTELS